MFNVRRNVINYNDLEKFVFHNMNWIHETDTFVYLITKNTFINHNKESLEVKHFKICDCDILCIYVWSMYLISPNTIQVLVK